MNNPLYLTYASPSALNHGTNGMLPAQLLLASYTAGSKLRITSGRLQEPAASYNRLIIDQPVVDKAVAVFLVFYIISTADNTKLIEAEIRLDNDTAAQHRLTGEALEDRISNYTRAQMKGACLEACVALVVSTYLVQFGFSDLAVGYVALLAISQLVSVETHELSYFSTFTTSGPLRGSALTQFNASRTENGFDCAICQEDIGEAEWIYTIPCQHQFHR